MAKNTPFVAFVVAGLSLIVPPDPASACSCISPGPACENYWKMEHVFDGTVLSITETSHTETVAPGREFQMRRRVVRFQVHRAFKGVDGTEVEVTTGLGGGDCGYDFKVGARYLVFGHHRSQYDGRIEAGICSATQPYDARSDAVAWLQGLSEPSRGASVFGSVTRQDDSTEFATTPARERLNGIALVLEGADGQRRTESRDGQYRFSGIPPGEYVLRAELPEGLWRPDQPRRVSLPDLRSCAEVDIFTAVDGRIRGLVLRHDSTPAANLAIEAAPADADLDGRRVMVRMALTADDGRFELQRLPPGRYVVGVNLRDWANRTLLYPRILFANADGSPVVVKVGPGEGATIGSITLPPPVVLRRVTGRVLDEAGRPVPDVDVVAKEVSKGRPRPVEGARSDAAGLFELRVRAGGRYVLQASRRERERIVAEATIAPFDVSDSDVENVVVRLKPASDQMR